MNLNGWKDKCNREDMIKLFIKGDHFKVGLDNGMTVIQIMDKLGFKNPSADAGLDILAKYHARNILGQTRNYFFRNGFILSSKKLKNGTPSIHFLIDNLSEERTERHYRLKRRVEVSSERFREDKLSLLQLINKVTDEKIKQHFKEAYSSRPSIHFDESKVRKLLSPKNKKPLKLEVE